jgi:hypothetical protein
MNQFSLKLLALRSSIYVCRIWRKYKDYYYYYYYTRLDLIHTRLKSHPLSTRCHPDSARSHTRRLDLMTIFGTEAKQPEINPRDQTKRC